MTGESYMEKNRNGKIVIKKFTKARAYLTVTLIVFCITGLYTIFTIDTGDINIGNALREFIKNLQEMFLGARLSDRYSFLEIFQSLGVSLSLAMMSTMIGGFIALFLSFFAAENLSGRRTSKIMKPEIVENMFKIVASVAPQNQPEYKCMLTFDLNSGKVIDKKII